MDEFENSILSLKAEFFCFVHILTFGKMPLQIKKLISIIKYISLIIIRKENHTVRKNASLH